MNESARITCKTLNLVKREWFEKAGKAGICSAECLEALTHEKPVLLLIRADEIRVPESWTSADPQTADRLAKGLREALPGGLPASMRTAVISAIEHLACFVQLCEASGTFTNSATVTERELQDRLRDHLRSRGVEVQEGSEVGGGETDLVLPGPLIVENKVRQQTANPAGTGANYPYQARRYSIAVGSSVSFVVVAYKPANESALLPMPQRIIVHPLEGAPEGHASVKIQIPWGHGLPSDAKRPKPTT